MVTIDELIARTKQDTPENEAQIRGTADSDHKSGRIKADPKEKEMIRAEIDLMLSTMDNILDLVYVLRYTRDVWRRKV